MNEDVFSKPPAHGRIANWLGPQTVVRLLDYAQSRRENFFVSGVGYGENKRVDLAMRRSSKLKDLGDLKDELRQRARAAVPAMCDQLGTPPFEPSEFELELVAHGDGAFYTRHRDTNIRQSGLVNRRVISAVYYFHRNPKSFSGGALRIYSFEVTEDRGTFVDIEPANDTLVFFPSWFPHEVLPVVCPSGRFEDSRFAINCWVHR
jgi:Rps23 Pro-64 3,4-dihydroxylase Tpa1-like proline 4-hydroxylase